SKNGIMFASVTSSNASSAKARREPSPTSKVTRGASSGGSCRRASATIAGARSTPITSASGNRRATAAAATPVPVPRSSTRRGGEVPLAARGELDARARHDRRLLQMLAGEVERDVAEAVDAEHGGADPRPPHLRLRQVEPDERLRVDRRTELGRRHAEREMGA